MLKAVIFASGMVAGVAAIPATLMYVKPVRQKISKAIFNKMVDVITNDAEARTELIDIATDFTAGLIIIDEIKKETK